jgi:hypothetical protein
MNHSSIASFILVGTFMIGGCAATVDRQGSPEQTKPSAQSLTLTQCATQRDACLANNPLFGLFACPAQYTLCTVTASNGLPAQVNSAISDAAACTRANRECVNSATTATDLAACATTQAECVASIVQVHLPKIVSGTATCVDNSVKCINAAEQVSDLTACANNLQSCAVTQVQAVVPEGVGQTIGSVSACQTTLNTCISDATTPAAVTACSETGARCVANGLGVTLPDVSVTAVVRCADTAANCALDASTVEDVAACASSLRSCAAEAVGSTSTPPAMTCAQKWTACLARNPLNFLLCDVQLATCQN